MDPPINHVYSNRMQGEKYVLFNFCMHAFLVKIVTFFINYIREVLHT